MKVTLLGTGCPLPNPARSAPSQIVWAGDEPLLFDCGVGTLAQIVRAGVDPVRVKELFFTHHHFDHNGGYADFAITGWVMGRRELNVYGPRDTGWHTEMLLKSLYRQDVEYRLSLGRPISGIWDVDAKETSEGLVVEKNGWRVTTTAVSHYDPLECVGYRIEHAGRCVVVSGDSTYCESLVRLAQGADVLVMDCSLFKRPGEMNPGHTDRIWQSLQKQHCTPEQAGQIAREAGAQTLVLSHLLPSADAGAIRQSAAAEFRGQIIVGEDLLQVEC